MQKVNRTIPLLLLAATHIFFLSAAHAGSLPLLKSVSMSGKGYEARLEVTADKPLTYTYYKMPDLLRFVVDLAMVEPGQIASATGSSPLVSRVAVEKKDISNFSLTRIVAFLERDSDFVVQQGEDKTRLVVLFTAKPPQPASGQNAKEQPPHPPVAASDSLPAAASAAAVLPPAAASPTPAKSAPSPLPIAPKAASKASYKAEPAATPPTAQKEKAEVVSTRILQPVVPRIPSRTISTIKVKRDDVEIVANSRLDDYRAFTLDNPGRLVIDLPLAKAALRAKDIVVKRFGLTKARLGEYPDKVRIVLDAEGKSFPRYTIDRTNDGLTIRFPTWAANSKK